MAKTATVTKTKTATKAASEKTKKSAEPKTKRAPTAYNVYMKAQLALWKAEPENKGKSHQEAFSAVASSWKDAPENPNRGKEAKPKKPKAKKNAAEASGSSDAEAEGGETSSPGSSPGPAAV